MKGIKIIFSVEEFAKKGFNAEIARYMQEHKNCAIVGSKMGINRHVIQYNTRENYNKYCDILQEQESFA